MLTIGSRALNDYGLEREPKDFDCIGSKDEYLEFLNDYRDRIVHIDQKKFGSTIFMTGSKPVEFEIAELRPSTKEILEYCGNDNRVPPLEVLYLLKMSHRYLKNSPHFEKTRNDIRFIRRMSMKLDGTTPTLETDWVKRVLKMREKETYDYKLPSLMKTKNDFFTDDFYVYDHDSIHLAVKIDDKPAYEYFKPDPNVVACSKDLFFALPEKVRLNAVYEESAVLALERHQIPNDFKPDANKSFKMALQKVCTSITSGWFREYAWENYDKVLMWNNSHDYISDFYIARNNGILKPWVKL